MEQRLLPESLLLLLNSILWLSNENYRRRCRKLQGQHFSIFYVVFRLELTQPPKHFGTESNM
jgi:hypothetical protein